MATTRKPVRRPASTAVRIYPVPGISVPPGDFSPPILAREQEVDAGTWAKLQEYRPAPFTTTPPADEAAADKEAS
jgi:hypothetical protein